VWILIARASYLYKTEELLCDLDMPIIPGTERPCPEAGDAHRLFVDLQSMNVKYVSGNLPSLQYSLERHLCRQRALTSFQMAVFVCLVYGIGVWCLWDDIYATTISTGRTVDYLA
jgi:hypothetical protein